MALFLVYDSYDEKPQLKKTVSRSIQCSKINLDISIWLRFLFIFGNVTVSTACT